MNSIVKKSALNVQQYGKLLVSHINAINNLLADSAECGNLSVDILEHLPALSIAQINTVCKMLTESGYSYHKDLCHAYIASDNSIGYRQSIIVNLI